jgi:hypothetical protein
VVEEQTNSGVRAFFIENKIQIPTSRSRKYFGVSHKSKQAF